MLFCDKKPDFYYLLFEKAVVQTTAKNASGTNMSAFDKLGS